MKTIIKIILIIIAILLGNKNLFAQNTQIDSEIRIAERILEEIFKSTDTNARYMLPGHRMVQGEYIQGIGVHFRVGSGQAGVIYIERENRNSDTRNEISREWIEERMLEYYNGYAAQLRSVPDNEQVRITYGSGSGNNRVVIVGQRRENSQSRPKLTAWASMADIKRYASGNLSDSQFRNRLSINDLSEAEEKRDLNIFASVLEASMNSANAEHLRVRRKPTYEYLPGFGAHFNINVNTGSMFSFGILEDMAIELDEVEFDDFDIHVDLGEIKMNNPSRFEFHPDSMNISIQQFADSMKAYSARVELDTAEIRRQAERAQQQAEEMRGRIEMRIAERDTIDLTGDAGLLMNELRQTMRDYGSTLSSLQDNELLVITVNWEGRNRSMPERTRVQITKSDLLRGAEPDIEEIRRR